MYYVDSYFEIGSSHDICQDYSATYVDDDIALAAVSDGCSSSHQLCGTTDIGARAYVWSILRGGAINDYIRFMTEHPTKPEEIARVIGNHAFRYAEAVKTTLGLLTYSLDATLGLAWVRNGKATVIAFGDLDFVVKTKDMPLPVLHSIVYDSGAPYYLTYDYDCSRGLSYTKEFEGCPVKLVKTTIDDGDATSEQITSSVQDLGDSPSEWRKNCIFHFENVDWIVLFTDGLRSFQKEIDESPGLVNMSENTIAQHLTKFKNPKGRYVLRRMNMFRKKVMTPQRLLHYDDLGIAAICGTS